MDIYAPREKEIDNWSIGERGGKSKDYIICRKLYSHYTSQAKILFYCSHFLFLSVHISFKFERFYDRTVLTAMKIIGRNEIMRILAETHIVEVEPLFLFSIFRVVSAKHLLFCFCHSCVCRNPVMKKHTRILAFTFVSAFLCPKNSPKVRSVISSLISKLVSLFQRNTAGISSMTSEKSSSYGTARRVT